MITISDIIYLQEIVKISKISALAGMSPNLLQNKINNKTELNVKQSQAVSKVLQDFGIEYKKPSNST